MGEQKDQSDDVRGPPVLPLPPVIRAVPARKAKPTPEWIDLMGFPLRIRDTAALVVLTVLADVCLYRAAGGTGGAVLVVVSLAVLLALRGGRLADPSVRVGLAVLALAVVLVWSAWWLVVVMATVSICIFAVYLWRPEWSLPESLMATVDSVLHSPVRLIGHFVAHYESSKKSERSSIPAKVIVIPLVVTVGFLIVFSAANPVVSREFGRLWDKVADVFARLNEYLNVGRFFFWCGWLLVFAALIRPALRSALIDRLMELDVRLAPLEESPAGEDNFLVAYITLVCVNVVFLGYNCMDAVYLYFKAALPSGITWTAYTHEGCGWLTFGLFLSTVVLGFMFWDRLNFHRRSEILKLLAYVWIAQNAVLAFGTLRRIHMYIDYSGLTHLLLTGVYGSLLVMAGLVIMALKVCGNRNAVWLLRRYVAAFAVGLTVLALTPHGWVCASYNVPRIMAGKPHSLWPVVLKELPADALPIVVQLLDYKRSDGDAAKEKLVREGVTAILGQRLTLLENEEGKPWTQWQASSWWALKRLRAAKEKIEATVPPGRWVLARNRLTADYDLSGEP